MTEQWNNITHCYQPLNPMVYFHRIHGIHKPRRIFNWKEGKLWFQTSIAPFHAMRKVLTVETLMMKYGDEVPMSVWLWTQLNFEHFLQLYLYQAVLASAPFLGNIGGMERETCCMDNCQSALKFFPGLPPNEDTTTLPYHGSISSDPIRGLYTCWPLVPIKKLICSLKRSCFLTCRGSYHFPHWQKI